ncbi:hypothetical protein SKAU_G00262590 [Synaphobranchus kaupii]|uniref:Uncharacterized protein n=1 Tax=Synaphobranchus kaupii TaxID=118154 RepID=A0A9Q1INU8_SYNKA|nr:hypothetical protein SKAU_G00262590 [Synaphobranchus kaupii]
MKATHTTAAAVLSSQSTREALPEKRLLSSSGGPNRAAEQRQQQSVELCGTAAGSVRVPRGAVDFGRETARCSQLRQGSVRQPHVHAVSPIRPPDMADQGRLGINNSHKWELLLRAT